MRARRTLFSQQLSPILRRMRILPILFLCFCSLISGWTAALAQIQTLEQTATAHHHSHVPHSTTATVEICCDDATADSGHHGKQVHPVLCAACFAVEAAPLALRRRERLSVRIPPLLQDAMTAADIKPLYPPPKS